MKLSRGAEAIANMVASVALFSCMNLFARVASNEGMHFTIVAFTRASLGASVAFAVSRIAKRPLRIGDGRRMALRSGFGTLAMVCTFGALSTQSLHLGDAVTLFNLAPVFIAVLSPFWLKEAPNRGLWLSLLLSLCGIALVLRPTFLFGVDAAHAPSSLAWPSLGLSSNLGAALAVGAAMSSAVAMMMLRQVGQTETSESIAVHFGVSASVVFFMLALPHWHVPNAKAWLALVATGLCGGFAQLAMTRAYSLEKAARISSFGYLSVPITALLGIVFLHESSAALRWLGMATVILAGLLTSLIFRDKSTTAISVPDPQEFRESRVRADAS